MISLTDDSPVHTALKGYKKSKEIFEFLASEWTFDHENKLESNILIQKQNKSNSNL